MLIWIGLTTRLGHGRNFNKWTMMQPLFNITRAQTRRGEFCRPLTYFPHLRPLNQLEFLHQPVTKNMKSCTKIW
jgi:hypothetical protein